MDRDLRIRMRAEGAQKTQQALRGVSRAAKSAGHERRRDAQTTRRSVEREEAEIARAAKRAVDRSTREHERGEKRKRRASRETAREMERDIQRVERAERRHRNTTRNGGGGGARRGGFRLSAGQIASGAAAVGATAFSRVQGYQGALGIPSRDELVARYIDSEQTFIRTARNAGLSREERAQLRDRAIATSRTSNIAPTEILDALSRAQAQLGPEGMRAAAESMDLFAQTAYAADANIGDVILTMGQFGQQLGVAREEIPDLVGALATAANEGAIEISDFASTFSPIMSSFANLRGEGGRGQSGAREFLAVAESLGAGGAGPEQTRTMMAALMRRLGTSRTRRGIERTLGDRDIFDRSGTLQMSMGELLGRMSENEAFRTPAGLERMGFDDESARALQILMGRFEATGGNEVERLQNVSASEGRLNISETVRDLKTSTSGRAVSQRVSAEANFLENGENLISTMEELTAPLTEFTTRMPLASEAVSFLGEAARNAGISIAAFKMMGGGAGGGGGLGALFGGGGGGGGAAAAGGILAPVAAFVGTTLWANDTATEAQELAAAPGIGDDQERTRRLRASLSPEAIEAARTANVQRLLPDLDATQAALVQGRLRNALHERQDAGMATTAADVESMTRAFGAALRSGPIDVREVNPSGGQRDERRLPPLLRGGR